jgi:hypothetical protein
MQYGENNLTKYRGANLLLCSYKHKYNNLSENAKKHLKVDMGELEKLAVNVLVDQGYSDIVNQDLLKKYRSSKDSVQKHRRQNPNTK